MRLPKDTNCVCTQHAVMVKGKQTEHGRKSLQLPAWGCVLKDLLQGRVYYPHHPASMGWISPHRAQVWERTVAKVGMGIYSLHLCLDTLSGHLRIPEHIEILRWEKHWGGSYWYSLRSSLFPRFSVDEVLAPQASWAVIQHVTGTLKLSSCPCHQGAIKQRLNLGPGNARYFWAAHVYCQYALLGPSPLFFCLCVTGWQEQHWQESKRKGSGRWEREGSGVPGKRHQMEKGG